MRVTAAVPVEAFCALPERIADALRPETMRVVRTGARALETSIEAVVEAAGLGRGMARTWQSRTYPVGREALTPAAVVWTNFPTVMRAFAEGATIRARGGTFLAIPTPEAIRLAGGPRRGLDGRFRSQRLTPREFRARTGATLRLVEGSGVRFLVARGAGGRGLERGVRFRGATPRDRRRGREREVVAFWLVRQATLRKRFDINALAAAARAQLLAALPGAVERAASGWFPAAAEPLHLSTEPDEPWRPPGA
jgi:Family of unknown function (DUF6441)